MKDKKSFSVGGVTIEGDNNVITLTYKHGLAITVPVMSTGGMQLQMLLDECLGGNDEASEILSTIVMVMSVSACSFKDGIALKEMARTAIEGDKRFNEMISRNREALGIEVEGEDDVLNSIRCCNEVLEELNRIEAKEGGNEGIQKE